MVITTVFPQINAENFLRNFIQLTGNIFQLVEPCILFKVLDCLINFIEFLLRKDLNLLFGAQCLQVFRQTQMTYFDVGLSFFFGFCDTDADSNRSVSRKIILLSVGVIGNRARAPPMADTASVQIRRKTTTRYACELEKVLLMCRKRKPPMIE